MNPVVRGDIVVEYFLDSVGGYRHKERRDRLLDILDVDLDWHMNAISDGERGCVRLCMGLMQPWDVLLLDEVRYGTAMVPCLDIYIVDGKFGRRRSQLISMYKCEMTF